MKQKPVFDPVKCHCTNVITIDNITERPTMKSMFLFEISY